VKVALTGNELDAGGARSSVPVLRVSEAPGGITAPVQAYDELDETHDVK
jgi:hypothetical protein